MTELEFTAYHEAGHAVIGAMLGGRVRSVTLEPTSDDSLNRYGDTQIEWLMAGVGPREHALRELKTALAGPAAESVYRDEYRQLRITQESSADWLAAGRHAQALLKDEAHQIALLHETLAQLVHLLRKDERVWNAVAALADELLTHDTVEAEQVDEVVGFWMRN